MNKFERTCVACYKKNNKNQFVKIVKNKNNEIIIDKNLNLNGRGAYICCNNDCIEKVCKKKLLNKTFKMNINDEIYEQLKNMR